MTYADVMAATKKNPRLKPPSWAPDNGRGPKPPRRRDRGEYAPRLTFDDWDREWPGGDKSGSVVVDPWVPPWNRNVDDL